MERTILFNCTILDPYTNEACPDGVLVLNHCDGQGAPDFIGYCGPAAQGPIQADSTNEDVWLDCEGGYMVPGFVDVDGQLTREQGNYATLESYRTAASALLRGLTTAGIEGNEMGKAMAKASAEMVVWMQKFTHHKVDESQFHLVDGSRNIQGQLPIPTGKKLAIASGNLMSSDGDVGVLAVGKDLVGAGVAPEVVFAAVTCNNADALGFIGTNGRLATGFEGDIVLVKEDPRTHFETLMNPLMTARGGRLIESKLKAMTRTKLAILAPGYSM